MQMQGQANCPLDEPPDPGEQQRRLTRGSYYQCQMNFNGVCYLAETERRSKEQLSDLYPLIPILTMEQSSARIESRLAIDDLQDPLS